MICVHKLGSVGEEGGTVNTINLVLVRFYEHDTECFRTVIFQGHFTPVNFDLPESTPISKARLMGVVPVG
jgi:hypothetical protein